eukprot:GHVU01067517.1.p7 GENE.GHVU01067517.1~~GHVU01067517.1.p7  ORF type:complete len:113 (-),score=7.90 GHVU01067517.1:1179-1517(-)
MMSHPVAVIYCGSIFLRCRKWLEWLSSSAANAGVHCEVSCWVVFVARRLPLPIDYITWLSVGHLAFQCRNTGPALRAGGTMTKKTAQKVESVDEDDVDVDSDSSSDVSRHDE